MLHLIFQNPLQAVVLERVGATDPIVLHTAAIYNVRLGHAMNDVIQQTMARHCRIYVLSEDLQACGIDASQILSGVNIIDYMDLVELTENERIVQTWR